MGPVAASLKLKTLNDSPYIKNSFNGFDFFKFGINCEEPEGAKVRVILIG